MEENREYEQLEEEQGTISYQESVANILKNMQTTNQALANIGEQMRQMQQTFLSPELKETLSNLGKVGSALAATVNSDAIKSFGEMALRLQSYQFDIPKFDFSKFQLPYIPIPKIQIPESLKKFAKEFAYLKNLEAIEWPLFVYDNDILKQRLTDYFDNADEGAYNLDVINGIIFEEITNDDIMILANSWKSSSVLSTDRIQILHEGAALYCQGFYYGCVSLMMCQLEGIITDIYEMHSDFGVQYTVEEAKIAYEHYTHKVLEGRIKITSEKNQLLCMMTKVDNGFFYWMSVIGYIYNVLLTSKEEMNQSNHPCRNKVCHGIQTNFGTKEHALKAILSIDMLINFAEEMRRVAEASEEN